MSPGSPAPFETRRFSIAEYHRLAEVGILSQDDRVELIEGVISPKMVHSPLHDATVSIVEHLFRGLLLPTLFLRVQSSVTLLASELEVFTQPRKSGYAQRMHLEGGAVFELGVAFNVGASVPVDDLFLQSA